MTHIFEALQLSLGWPRQAYEASKFHESATWIRVTWVCRYWRLVALECPSLWASIVDVGKWNNIDWLATFLERSRERPLTVDVGYTTMIPRDVLIPIQPFAHRIHRLNAWADTQPLSLQIIYLQFLLFHNA